MDPSFIWGALNAIIEIQTKRLHCSEGGKIGFAWDGQVLMSPLFASKAWVECYSTLTWEEKPMLLILNKHKAHINSFSVWLAILIPEDSRK